MLARRQHYVRSKLKFYLNPRTHYVNRLPHSNTDISLKIIIMNIFSFFLFLSSSKIPYIYCKSSLHEINFVLCKVSLYIFFFSKIKMYKFIHVKIIQAFSSEPSIVLRSTMRAIGSRKRARYLELRKCCDKHVSPYGFACMCLGAYLRAACIAAAVVERAAQRSRRGAQGYHYGSSRHSLLIAGFQHESQTNERTNERTLARSFARSPSLCFPRRARTHNTEKERERAKERKRTGTAFPYTCMCTSVRAAMEIRAHAHGRGNSNTASASSRMYLFLLCP